VEHASALHQNEVHPDIERGDFAGTAHGVVERIAVGHHGGSGQHAVAMRFDDSFIHIMREAEIVRVED
jgi:hypothetical protein